jgi:hypothetical protein
VHNRISREYRVATVKILSLQYPERYVVRRLVKAAQQELLARDLRLDLDIVEVDDPGEIGKYSYVLVLPTLVINEQVVCTGRFPAKIEVIKWLIAAAAESEK